MKKFIKKIVLSVVAVALSFGIAIPVYTVSAEETEIPKQENVIEEPEKNENSSDNLENSEKLETGKTDEISNDNINFESFLEWSKQEAEKYGYGNEYEQALKAIEAAASKEQVTISTIASAVLALSIFAYIIYKKIVDKKFKENISDISKKLDGDFVSLINKVGELVDGTNENTATEKEIKEKEELLLKDLKGQTEALSSLINAFMHFADGVSLKGSKKEEVQRDCINALEQIDKTKLK